MFLKSGWLKLSDWGQTVSLFESEYRVPLLPPHAAAVAGTCGELLFPIFVILGLAGRLSAIGLFAVNALAVISYAHVLFQEGSAAAGSAAYSGASCCSSSSSTARARSPWTACSRGAAVLRHARFLLTIAARISRYENNRTM